MRLILFDILAIAERKGGRTVTKQGTYQICHVFFLLSLCSEAKIVRGEVIVLLPEAYDYA